MTTIYALCDPSTGDVRYIGKTASTLKRRLREHCADGARAEIDAIAEARVSGVRLTNLTDGGDGLSGYSMTPEHRAKIAGAYRSGPRLLGSRTRRSKYRRSHGRPVDRLLGKN